jgi:hypothetical protein
MCFSGMSAEPLNYHSNGWMMASWLSIKAVAPGMLGQGHTEPMKAWLVESH